MSEERIDTYRLKKVQWKGKTIPIVMQNINGPCPLLAICNILLLQGKISIHTDFSMVNYEQLVALLGDLLLSQKPPVNSDLEQNYNQNVADAVALFPTLQFGLDVNVRFRNITDFEFTPELTVFDLFNIRIVHGWLISPYDQDSYESIGNLSYNEVVERLVHLSEHEGDETKDLSRERKIRDFMNTTASQLTPYGLEKLHEEIGEAEFAVFFRNNHFSVLYKHEGILYLLVTDQGYLYQQKIMWELFDSVDGDSHFVCPEFILYKPEENTPENIVLNNELIADEQLAAQLQREEEEAQKNAATEARIAQEKADHEMAMMLQQEEQQAGNGAIQPAAAPAAQQTVSAAAAPAPQQQVSLEHLYQAQQQGVQLTEEQTRQLNAFLSQRTESGDCAIM